MVDSRLPDVDSIVSVCANHTGVTQDPEVASLNAASLPFRPRARMLLLLGDQLIRDAGIAVFELVKNAYDADANAVDVHLFDIDDQHQGRIVVSDDGVGMNWHIVTEVWLEPGTDYRESQKKSGTKTPKHNRTPMGEKGIGRFAAHKLGSLISLVTRQADSPEVVVEIDWEDFFGKKYLSDTPVSVFERVPETFSGDSTGTRIEISRLNQSWTRGLVRDLYRSVTSISSPFRRPSDFIASLSIAPQTYWLAGLLDLQLVKEMAPFRATCLIEDTSLTIDYTFEPPVGMEDRVVRREVRDKCMSFGSIVNQDNLRIRQNIGDLYFDLRIFDLDPRVLQFLASDKKGFRAFLRQNGGIRVYRDGVRVFDYGEPRNDWLGLGTARVNAPTKRVSNNILLGAVELDGVSSEGLIEKTNREGFVENDEFRMFRELIEFALLQIVAERNLDKDRIRKAYASQQLKEPVLHEVEEFRSELNKRGLENELGDYLNRIERQFLDVRDQLLTAAGPGLTMSVVIHEVEKGISGLVEAIRRNAPTKHLSALADHLAELVEGLTYLTRKSGRRQQHASILITQAFFNSGFRLRAHTIDALNGTDMGDEDFSVQCTRRMIIASLMNLIDNSVYWLVNKGHPDKRIYIGTTRALMGGPALVIADNGPGFSDPPAYLRQPFITRRPEGMGLGLHIVDEVMKAHGGRLVFPERGDIALPASFNGAVVALQFEER
ncbi:MAG: ATP-binding protein [Bryobacterales bacterium]|nr:ATP-binding protein [Bryobacterales bacterium]MDE0629381.1 ATP-binding protein [Bryobacterales bacterium]